MRRYSITDKLLLASLILSILTIIIVASYSFYNARDAIKARTFNQLTSVRTVKSSLLESFFNNRLHEVELLSSTSDVKELIEKVNTQIGTTDGFIVDSFGYDLNKSLENRIIKYYTSIFAVGSNHDISFLWNKSNIRHFTISELEMLFNKTISSSSPIVTDLSVPETDTIPVITISCRVMNNMEEIIGIIVFELHHNFIDTIMLEDDPASGFGITGESYLVGDDSLMRSSSRFQSNSLMKTIVNTSASQNAFAGNSGTEIIEDYRGISVLSSWGMINIPDLNWVIIAEIDFDEATIPIYRIRNEIQFISIFIFFMVLVVVFVLSRRITMPIQRLNEATVELSMGNFNVNIQHKLKDELGDLTDTFNTMVNKLKEQSEELEFERDKSLTSLIDGQESERQRLSRELHDGLGQLLIALKLKFESCLISKDSNNMHNQNLAEMSELFNRTIDETRRMSNNLMPAVLSEFGLQSAIRNSCSDISDNSNIDINLEMDGNFLKISNKQNIYIFRIVQEALSNIVKHSNARSAEINLTHNPDAVKIEISDNGKGFDPRKNVKLKHSNGLNNIRDRVSLLKGKIEIESEKDIGTFIKIELPLN